MTTAATAVLAATPRMHVSLVPLILALLSLSVLLALLAALLVLANREHEHAISLGGQTTRVRLRAFETREVVLPGNRVFSVRGRLIGAPGVVERPPANQS